MTRQLLCEQYRREHPDGLSICQFKHYFARWKAQTGPVMSMEHKAGDKLYVDFDGDKLSIVDPATGKVGEGRHPKLFRASAN